MGTKAGMGTKASSMVDYSNLSGVIIKYLQTVLGGFLVGFFFFKSSLSSSDDEQA